MNVFHQVVLIEGVNGFGGLNLQLGVSRDHKLDNSMGQRFNEEKKPLQLKRLERLERLQLELDGDEGEEDGSEILTSFLDQLEEENRRYLFQNSWTDSDKRSYSLPQGEADVAARGNTSKGDNEKSRQLATGKSQKIWQLELCYR